MESDIEKTPRSKKPEIFYGYRILVAAFLCVFIYSGSIYGAFSLLLKSLQSDFGWSRAEIMIAFTISLLVMGVTAPFVGSLIDRYGVRGVISVGALLGGLGFVSLYLLDSLWHFYAAYVAIGIGMAAIGQVPASALVSNWFRKRRGTAIGVMSMGIGAGPMVFAPLIGGYFIPHFGWGVSYLVLALLVWMLIPLALLVIRTKPADMGLYPDGAVSAEGLLTTTASLPVSRGFSLEQAMGTPAFWLIAVTFFLTGFASLGVIQTQVPHLQDISFSSGIAAMALGGVGLGSAIGKFAFGWLCDHMQAKYVCAISFVLLAIGTVIFITIKPASPLSIIWLYAIIMGLGAGGWLPTMSMLINTNFGLASYGAIFGMITLVQGVGGAIGPLFAGYIYDVMQTYQLAFIVFLVLFVVSIPVVLAIRRSRPLEAWDSTPVH